MEEAAIQARKATAQVEQRVADLIRSAIADVEKEWAGRIDAKVTTMSERRPVLIVVAGPNGSGKLLLPPKFLTTNGSKILSTSIPIMLR